MIKYLFLPLFEGRYVFVLLLLAKTVSLSLEIYFSPSAHFNHLENFIFLFMLSG